MLRQSDLAGGKPFKVLSYTIANPLATFYVICTKSGCGVLSYLARTRAHAGHYVNIPNISFKFNLDHLLFCIMSCP
jgi:hypothetical protein